MPIINQDDPLVYPNLVFVGSNVDTPIVSDTVVMLPRYSQHTILCTRVPDMIEKNVVFDVDGVKCRTISVDRTVYNSNIIICIADLTATLPFTSNLLIKPFHNFHPIDNMQLTDSSIQYNVQNNKGMYLYLDYTKGIETDVRMFFTVRDSKQIGLNLTAAEYSLMIVTDINGLNVPYNLKVSTTGRYSVPVNFAEPTNFITVNFAYSGATPVTGGNLKLFVNNDINYYA